MAHLGISTEIRLPKKPTHQAVVHAVIDCACGLQTELVAPAKMLIGMAPFPVAISCQRCANPLTPAIEHIVAMTRETLDACHRREEGN